MKQKGKVIYILFRIKYKLESLVVEYGDKWIESQCKPGLNHLVGFDGIYSNVADIAKKELSKTFD